MSSGQCVKVCTAGREVDRVFTCFDHRGIRYCHWKSNAHLADSFASKTDFDLLVDERDADLLRACLGELGVKQRRGTPDKVHHGMEDYLGFDAVSGDLFHLHVHYQLVFGRRLEKDYRLPIEDEVLETAIDDEEFPIKKIRPELEMMVLIVRIILKYPVGLSAAAKSVLRPPKLPANIRNEFAYLTRQIDREQFRADVMRHLPSLAEVFECLLEEGVERPSHARWRGFRRRVTQALAGHRVSTDRQLRKQLSAKKAAARRSRTWLGDGGIGLAFVGADGAGKSSLVADLARWLGWKLSVETAYMGIPKNDSWLRALKIMTWMSHKARCGPAAAALKRLRWVHVAKYRYRTFLRLKRLARQGSIVLVDRFPLTEFRSMDQPMDGPRIRERSIARSRERRFYEGIEYPDTIFVLRVSEKESLRRKGNATPAQRRVIAEKVSAVNQLVANGTGRFIDVDTHEGREETLLNIKRRIWEIL